jgi:hypothetical protein
VVGAQRRKRVAWQRLIRYQQTAAPIVESVLEGYNGTIFCYGQTGAQAAANPQSGSFYPSMVGLWAAAGGASPPTSFPSLSPPPPS